MNLVTTTAVIFLPYLITFFVTAICLWAAIPIATRFGLVDTPSSRKQHSGVIPLVGGIGIVIGFCIGILSLNISLSAYRSLLAGILLMVLIGLLDDLHELKPRIRLGAQIVAGLLMSLSGGIYLHDLGAILFFGPVILGHWGILLTIFAVVCISNAVNMLDGIDGLVGGVSWVQVMLLLSIALYEKRLPDVHILALLASALLAFLCFNFPFSSHKRASVFMGDAGTMVLGFVLVWFTVSLSQGTGAVSPVIMLWVMIVPIFDFCAVVALRLIQHKPLMQADRQHVHYVLQRMGMKPVNIVCLLMLVTVFLSLCALGLQALHISEGYLFAGFCSLLLLYILSHIIKYKAA